MKKAFLFGWLALIVVVFSACNAYTNISSTTEPQANFSQYKTFAWLADKTDTINSHYNNEIIRNNMRNYFGKEMSDRGFRVNVEQPDLLLELVVQNETHIEWRVQRDNYYYAPYYYRSRYFSPYERRYYYTRFPDYYYTRPNRQVYTDKHIDNTVTLNVVATKEQKLLWSGTVQADIYDPSVIQKDIHPAIIKLMKQFPVKPINNDNKAVAMGQ
jgi:hypothetical protein